MAGVSNGQAGNADTFNSAFVTKLGTSNILGLINLKNTESGAEVINLQQILNNLLTLASDNEAAIAEIETILESISSGYIASTQDIADGGEIALSNNKMQLIKLTVDDNEVSDIDLSVTPFGTALSISDGAIIRLYGNDSAYGATLLYNDSDYGCLINGDLLIDQFVTIELMWDATALRFIEQWRNV